MIDSWEDDGKPNDESFVLGSTGDVLQGLGAKENDIYINGSKINTILKEHPEMSLDVIKKIPEILENPILVLSSKNKVKNNTRMVMFGRVNAENGKPVLCVLDLIPTEDRIVLNDMQKAVSAYSKTNSEEDIKSFFEKSEVLYASKNKKITNTLLRRAGFSMPTNPQFLGYIGSITYKGPYVNIKGKPFNEVFSYDTNNSISGNAENDTKFSIDDTDNEYINAVNSGDTDTAQRLVDEAAKEAGYTIKAYHGTNADFVKFEKIDTEPGFWFTEDFDYSKQFGEKSNLYYIKMQRALNLNTQAGEDVLWDNLKNVFGEDVDESKVYTKEFRNRLISLGYNGLIFEHSGKNTYIVFNSEQIKSAEPITYDDNGEVIPLSERFNESEKDIRYSIDDDIDIESADWYNENISGIVNSKVTVDKKTYGMIVHSRMTKYSSNENIPKYDVLYVNNQAIFVNNKNLGEFNIFKVCDIIDTESIDKIFEVIKNGRLDTDDGNLVNGVQRLRIKRRQTKSVDSSFKHRKTERKNAELVGRKHSAVVPAFDDDFNTIKRGPNKGKAGLNESAFSVDDDLEKLNEKYGTIKKGANAERDIDVPKKTSGYC